MLLIVVDAHSTWLDVFHTPGCTSMIMRWKLKDSLHRFILYLVTPHSSTAVQIHKNVAIKLDVQVISFDASHLKFPLLIV